jgi:hypothetical protein
LPGRGQYANPETMSRLLAMLFAAFASLPTIGASMDRPVRRNQSGTINYAPRPGVFTVVSVDAYNRTVRLRARNGAAADVYVGDRVYDLAKLKPGDRLQVDFLVPDDVDKRLAAATIWPLR